jgi:hypothetical protein
VYSKVDLARLIALMLGALGMSVKQAIASYGILAESVFSESNLAGDGSFKASNLEHAVKKIVKERTGHEDERMIEKGSRVRKCKTCVGRTIHAFLVMKLN